MATTEIDDLFARTLEGNYDDDAPWEAVQSLRRNGSREVFDLAAMWIESAQPLKRARGLDVVAQLGKTVEHPSNCFPKESYDLVSQAVQHERDFLPLRSAIAALGHLDDPRAVPLLAQFHLDPDPKIRFSVACALGSFPNDALSLRTLIAMTNDADEDVRDWVTFGIGVLGDEDSSEIRDSLYLRLDDSNSHASEEAMLGLAKRGDLRVLPKIIDLLTQPAISSRAVEADCLLLGIDDDREDMTGDDYVSALCQRFPR